MSKTFLQLKFGPATLNLPTLVGQPIYRDSVIGLENQAHVELLTGADNQFHTVYEDGSTRNWFEDVTASYSKGKKAAAPAASVEDGEDEDEGEDEDGTDGEGADGEGTGTAPAAGAAPAVGQRKRTGGAAAAKTK